MSRPPVIKPLSSTERWVAFGLELASIICVIGSLFLHGLAGVYCMTLAIWLSIADLRIVKANRP